MPKHIAYAEWVALHPVRAAIQGWEFQPLKQLTAYIDQGEAQIKLLPEDLWEIAEEYLKPIRVQLHTLDRRA